MKLKSIKLENHPGVGDLSLSFCDDQGIPFNVVVLAGESGTGKTAVLESIQRTFEGRLGGNFGVITIELVADADDLARMAHAQGGPKDLGKSSVDFTLRFDSGLTGSWAAFSLGWVDSSGASVKLNQFIAQQPDWRNVFRSFFSEANVNFESKPTQYITGLGVDDPSITGARSGVDLAGTITQLLVDVRAADAEDVIKWVEQNPGIVPPISVTSRRLARFSDAFHSMFPNKRFKEVRHAPEGHSVEFEEFGRTNSIDNLSTGEKQIVFRAGFLLRSLAEARSSIVLIDEPELSLHPDWQGRIVSFYTSLLGDGSGGHAQILISTHSPFIVHGAANAKVIVLEKDDATGIIREMPAPAYPMVRGSEAVRAFNIDGFLEGTKKPLLILTEGESDVVLFREAWRKLRPNKSMDFELRAALGAKNINITLNDVDVFSKLGERILLGVFDFDSAYNQWNGVWSKLGKSVQSTEADGLIKQHPNKKGWAMLLPVPVFRQDFASATLAGGSILSAEFLFQDSDIPVEMIDNKQVALGHALPHFKDSAKSQFAKQVKNLPAASFASFEPLLARPIHADDGIRRIGGG